jgi:hypothetical protein
MPVNNIKTYSYATKKEADAKVAELRKIYASVLVHWCKGCECYEVIHTWDKRKS